MGYHGMAILSTVFCGWSKLQRHHVNATPDLGACCLQALLVSFAGALALSPPTPPKKPEQPSKQTADMEAALIHAGLMNLPCGSHKATESF